MPTTTPLKRPTTTGGSGGRLVRLLTSLRAPARKGPLPVQTGFPTSLADIIVKHHARLTRKNPRRQRHHRGTAAASPPADAAVAEAPPPPRPEPVPPQAQERRELSVPQAHDAAASSPAPATVTVAAKARPGKGAGGFNGRPSPSPWIVAFGGGAVVVLLLALLVVVVVVWSKQLVAAATLASVALSWIESAGIVRRRPRRPDTEAVESVESESDSGSSQEADAASCDLGCDDESSPAKRKQSRRRSLRKLLAGKLRSGKTTKHRGTVDSRHGEHEHPGTPRSSINAEAAVAAAGDLADETPAAAMEAITVDESGGALPLPALVPIILAGLVAGKLPALALAVLCAAFSSSVDTVAVPVQDSGDPR